MPGHSGAPFHGKVRRLTTLLLAAVVLAVFASPVVSQGPDLIVVGAGPGGLAAALEAARGGARVTVVEMGSVFGGHAVVSEGGLSFAGTPLQRRLGIDDAPETMFADIVKLGGDANPEWARLFAEKGIPEIHDWLVSLGVAFTSVQRPNGNSVPRFHENPRRGFGVVEPLYRAALATGAVEFVWSTRVTRLLVESGRVVGVEGTHERTGARRTWRAASVVLATGGFQSNLALVKAHWPQEDPVPARILIGAGVNAQGTGLDLATGAGAALERLDHQWNYPRGVVDPRYPGADRGLNVIFGTRFAWLNGRGERIWAEKVADMLAQPGGRVVLLFDVHGRGDFRISGGDWADRRRVDALLDNPAIARKANSLIELAGVMGLPADAVARTVERWNAFVASGEDTELGLFSTIEGHVCESDRRAPALRPDTAVPRGGGVAADAQEHGRRRDRLELPCPRPGAPADSRPVCRRRGRRLRRAERPGVDRRRVHRAGHDAGSHRRPHDCRGTATIAADDQRIGTDDAPRSSSCGECMHDVPQNRPAAGLAAQGVLALRARAHARH